MFRKLINWMFGTNISGKIDLTPTQSVQVAAPVAPVTFGYPYSVSPVGIALIKKWEKLELEAYPDDSGGVWTIGYGQTGPDVVKGKKITQQQAENLLTEFLKKQTAALNVLLKDVPMVGQGQIDALSSLIYNIGIQAFKNSTMYQYILKADWKNATLEFVNQDKFGEYHGWIYDNGKKIKGLINRRIAEKEMFLRSSLKLD